MRAAWKRAWTLDTAPGAARATQRRLTEAEVGGVAEAALGELPERARALLRDVPIVVAELPAEADVDAGLDPRSLGLFSGTAYARRVPPGRPAGADADPDLPQQPRAHGRRVTTSCARRSAPRCCTRRGTSSAWTKPSWAKSAWAEASQVTACLDNGRGANHDARPELEMANIKSSEKANRQRITRPRATSPRRPRCARWSSGCARQSARRRPRKRRRCSRAPFRRSTCAASKGVIKRGTASRSVSRLTVAVSGMKA